MESADSNQQPEGSRSKDNDELSEIKGNYITEKMKRVDVKPSSSPTSFLAKSSVLLPTGVARVKQISGVASESSRSATGSGSATGNPRNKTALAPGHSLMDWIRLGSSGVDLTGVGGVNQAITLTELAKHNQRNDAWIAIRGIVFNVTRYMDFHPGGVPELMKGVGKDATKLFEDVHAWVNYQSILQKCVVGRLIRGNGVEGPTSPFGNDKITKLSPLAAGAKTSGTDRKTSTTPQTLQSDWKQTTNTVTFVYKPSRDQQSPNFQLTRQSSTEFTLKTQFSSASIRHEYDLDEGVQWPPTWRRNYESMEVEFTFTKTTGKLWNSYGTRTVAIDTKNDRCYRDWEVVSNTSLCDSVNLLVLRCSDYMEVTPVGRHIEAKMSVLGMDISRSYTPVPPSLHPDHEAPGYKPNSLCLMIKRYDDGALTPSITALQQGQCLSLSNSLGTFVAESFDDYTAIHMLAAGTGLTPMLGIIHRSLCRRNVSSINLVNFNRNEKSIFYREQLDRVCSDNRLNVVHVLSQADENWGGRRGIVSEDLIKEVIGECNKQACVFTCGPKGFMTAAKTSLLKLGWQPSQMHEFDG
ncbi:cytochrome b5 reductase 4 isoform X1 [Diachasma alloeum]|uniref:cytochrome b5 reductase 4 isoform X1 n=1 Tax=Diachasma alloeum TaxID=454923 RepID=UPI00073815DC|nr:cytochrome b5 reductase 4 isoform X1 [Diachasma alloeum]XP_015113820.1 cytochrome b5 reductase 4 isoform X1 [Diachasma alloeum]